MKALTLIQPWATLIAMGEKRIETRAWGTRHRGRIAVHAGKKVDMPEFVYFDDVLADHGIVEVDDMPTGAVIATATLVDCVQMTNEWIARVPDEEQEMGYFAPGRFGWVLRDVEIIGPHPQRGYQGLWDWDGAA